ncbi:MAG: vWA domain-containing protein [Candidatus Paceibacterota bacterium]
MAIAVSGCSDSLSGSSATNSPEVSATRLKDRWIDTEVSKSASLEGNLLRRNIYLIFDCSGSMDGDKIEIAKKAINQFATSVPEDMGIGIAIFDKHGLSERLPLGINNRKQFNDIVNSARAGGGTPLSEAVRIGYEALRSQAKCQLGYGEYHLVIVTDGEANPGCDPTEMVNQVLQDSPVVIHTIGFRIGERHSLNQPGRTIYKDAQSPEGLAEGLQSVLAESEKF